MDKFILLNEMTRKDILAGVSPEPWSKQMKERVQGYYLSLTDVELNEKEERCVIVFTIKHPTRSTHDVMINLKDFWIYWDAYDRDPKNLRKALHDSITDGDIYVNCSCPHWVYGGYKYMATQLDYSLDGVENRFPKVRNPKLLGTICKHLYVGLQYLPNNEMTIYPIIKRKLGV